MRVLAKRGAVINWAGRVHAYPVLAQGLAEFSRAGGDEAGLSRVGWKTFFAQLRKQNGLVVVDDDDAFPHRVLPAAQARRELPREAFGPPWYVKVWREVNLVGSSH